MKSIQAANLAQAFEQLQTYDPEWVLLDLMLPDGHGGDLLAHIRSNNLPTKVVITTGCHESQLTTIHQLKPELILMKPCNFDDLFALFMSDDSKPISRTN